jgi:hypothetical protein
LCVNNSNSGRSAQERAANILGRERVSNGRVKTREDNPIRKDKGPGLNLLFLTDLEKLARGRRGFGTMTLAGAELILDDAIPRLCRRWQAGVSDSARLVGWVDRHLPEIFAARDEAWIEARRKEVLGWKTHSLLTVDAIARKHRITQNEVESFCLEALVSFERPKHVRKRDRKTKDRDRKRASRIAAGATPQAESKTATKPWLALGLTRTAYYEQGHHKAPAQTIPDRFVRNSNYVKTEDEIVRNDDISPDAAAAEKHETTEGTATGQNMHTRAIFVTLKPAALTITHGTGNDGPNTCIDMSGLATASWPVEGKSLSSAGLPILYIPAIRGRVVEGARQNP